MKLGAFAVALLPIVTGVAGCGPSLSLSTLGAPEKVAASATQDAATRAAPVVVGRPARVFVFVGLGERCESLPAPELTIGKQPSKGEISFKPGQQTTVAASVSGKCNGQNAVGTGLYYVARAGSDGLDNFSVSAKLPSGETVSRDFEVRIEP